MTDPAAARHVTDALLAPLAGRDRDVTESAARVSEALSRLIARAGKRSIRLTDHDVRMALALPGERVAPTPFAWSALTTRRALGLAAVRSLIAGDVRTPSDGVGESLARIMTAPDDERTRSTMNRWLAGLPRSGLAAVHAEATTWATRLWCGLDWGAFGERPTIGRDHWWDSRRSPNLAIRSRAEVRAVTADRAGNPLSAHLVILGGARRASVTAELSVVALVETLCARSSLPPGRVVGWWPDSGHLVTVEVDRAAIDTGLATVSRVVSRDESPSVPPPEARPTPLTGIGRAAA